MSCNNDFEEMDDVELNCRTLLGTQKKKKIDFKILNFLMKNPEKSKNS